MVTYVHTNKRVHIPNEYVGAQDWLAYNDSDREVWRDLITAQTRNVRPRACAEWQQGLETLGLTPHEIPDYRKLDKKLYNATGWHLAVVSCFIPPDVFFYLLSKRHFPVTAWLRDRENMDYIPEPDMVHDVWAHTPVLTMWPFADYLQAFGKAGVEATKRGWLEQVQALYWYTVEFGLTRKDGDTKIYGAGILSSKGETMYVLDKPRSHHIAFDPSRVMRTNYRIDEFQLTYFVVDSFEQLLGLDQREILRLARKAHDGRPISWIETKKEDQILRHGKLKKTDDHGVQAKMLKKWRAQSRGMR
ncbi:MAG: phenylalanine 4-monooxygenase [Alphaproteobacteria bacterium]|nr:MAG: phenylalanine 4-monooxygenase [Alphaproteobacteria bacterium]